MTHYINSTHTDIQTAYQSLILSASGWRKVFAQDLNEESTTGDIGAANEVLVILMADAFADYLEQVSTGGTIAVAMDTRPTGPRIAELFCKVLCGRGFTIEYPGICAAPEIMAYARTCRAFVYVSASHNPVGHNGVKFGLNDGGVLSAKEAATLIAIYKQKITQDGVGEHANELYTSCQPEQWNAIVASGPHNKKATVAAYDRFSREVLSGSTDPSLQETFFKEMRQAISIEADRGSPLSLVCDFNGSARTLSIDKEFFASLGLPFFSINDQPGHIVHRIVPEGESLTWCSNELDRLRKEGPGDEERNVLFGYMPDCDGDRGNIVYWDEAQHKTGILEAQEVFALSVISELSFLAHSGITENLAIAVNDPTSLGIETIARSFGAEVWRAEVGEANVVNLARELRSRGKTVRILGEGSNGGNITHPSAVRDPLNTMCALIKLMTIRDSGNTIGLFHRWCTLSGQENRYHEDFTFADVRASLPEFTTTSVFESYAQLHITTEDHAVLKSRFQDVFIREWNTDRARIRTDWGFAGWKAIAYNGTVASDCSDNFAKSAKGGLKILFTDTDDNPVGCIWMRGSGTEPVFRILADIQGNDRTREERLRSWLTSMVLEADKQI